MVYADNANPCWQYTLQDCETNFSQTSAKNYLNWTAMAEV